MADATKTIPIVRRAAMLLRATAGRRGMVVHPVDAADLLVAGDLHGNMLNFKRILQIAKLGANPKRHLVLQEFVHGKGRFPNGACSSHQLLDLISALVCQFPNRVHLLPGNHEWSELTGRAIAKDGVVFNDLFYEGIRHSYGDAADDIVAAYHELIVAMPIVVRTENRLLCVHTVPDGKAFDQVDFSDLDLPVIPEERRGRGSTVHHLLWDRDVTEGATARFLAKFGADYAITGHIATPGGFQTPNRRRLILDCVGTPAACLLVSTTKSLRFEQLLEGIVMLKDAG